MSALTGASVVSGIAYAQPETDSQHGRPHAPPPPHFRPREHFRPVEPDPAPGRPVGTNTEAQRRLDGHMTPDERRLLRQHIEDAVRDLYHQ